MKCACCHVPAMLFSGTKKEKRNSSSRKQRHVCVAGMLSCCSDEKGEDTCVWRVGAGRGRGEGMWCGRVLAGSGCCVVGRAAGKRSVMLSHCLSLSPPHMPCMPWQAGSLLHPMGSCLLFLFLVSSLPLLSPCPSPQNVNAMPCHTCSLPSSSPPVRSSFSPRKERRRHKRKRARCYWLKTEKAHVAPRAQKCQ